MGKPRTIETLTVILGSFEEQARAGEAGFGFLEFGDVERGDVETLGFDAGASARERSGKNDCISKGQGIGGVRFGGVDVDPVVAGAGPCIEPRAVGQQSMAAQQGDGGLEVQAGRHPNGDDLVMVRREDGGELANAFGVAAFRGADEKFAADAQNVAALKIAWQSNILKFTKFRNGFGERHGFQTPRFCAERKNDGELIKDDGGILDEHGIGEIWLGGEGHDTSAEFFEKLFVGVMLLARDLEIDRLARDKA